jgi:tetratricopeptide (TPR) repeat protein
VEISINKLLRIHRKGERMKSSILSILYTQKELKCKVDEYIERYEQVRSSKDYQSMASRCYDIGRLFELLKDKEKSGYYYQKVVDDWNSYPDKIPYYLCVNALKALNKPEEAFKIVLAHAKSWDLKDLARFYEELGRVEEARLLYSGLATHALMLSRFCSFWQPHYLQQAADLREKAQDFEMVQLYNQRAVDAWEKMKDTIERPLVPIEEAWLFEEMGYIYEKAEKLETAMEYYNKAKSKYELAYIEDLTSTGAHQVDGDWDYYLRFFAKQIPDFRLIFFRLDGPEENDYRRIRFRILNLKEQT